MVNAIQRQAAVVVKKSLQEGFGLGVTEAMWKARPVGARAVGGHLEQIQHLHSGLLVQDPYKARRPSAKTGLRWSDEPRIDRRGVPLLRMGRKCQITPRPGPGGVPRHPGAAQSRGSVPRPRRDATRRRAASFVAA
ncbi:MAG: glycosyltransferase [Solirubrobacteraceae bacterium]